MVDKAGAEGAEAPEGNTEFADEFARLAKEEQSLSSEPDDASDLDDATDSGKDADKDGQEVAEPGATPPGEPAAKQPAGEEKPDIWADAPQTLRDAYEAERKAREHAERSARSQGGRASLATRELNVLRSQLASRQDKTSATEKGSEAADEEERMKQLREEYPDVAVPILDKLAKLEGQVRDLSGVAVAQADSRQEELLSEQERLLEQTHPGWKSELGDAFVTWTNSKPRHIRDAVMRNAEQIVDAEEVADILDRYKAETGPADTTEAEKAKVAERRAKQLNAGRIPAAKPLPAAAGSPDDFDAEWKRLAAIDARRANRNR